MDRLTVIGLAMAFAAILGGQMLEGGSFSALLNGPAAIIVLGGTLGATLVQTPMPVFRRAMGMLPWVIAPPHYPSQRMLDDIVSWSIATRKDGLLGLEKMLDSEPDSYVRKALGLLVDGREPEEIRSVMQLELELREAQMQDAAKVFDAMGGYAPTLGIVGAVLGLIQVMGNLADPDQLGPGIATAFVATIYGIGLANVVFLPIAEKLRHLARAQGNYQEMVLEGIVAISHGHNPRIIETRLNGFVAA